MRLLIFVGCFCCLLTWQEGSAQIPGPNLVITNFSVWSTLPAPDGQRRVAISFRVTNTGTAGAGSSTTRITVAGNVSTFTTPALAPQAAAFFTKTLTASSSISIKLETNVQLQLVNAPAARLERPLPGFVGAQRNGPSNTMQYTANPAGDYGRWEAIGPSKIATIPEESGRVTTIAVSPVDPYTIYAGGRDEGLWKAQGQTPIWFPITDALPTQEIDAVAIDPSNANRVMVITPSGVFQSLNAGSMWQQLMNKDLRAIGSDGGKLLIGKSPQPVIAERSAARINNQLPIGGIRPSQPIYISTKTGVLLSLDGGVTWNPVLADNSPVVSLQFSSTDPSQLFASTASPAAYEAQNGGLNAQSWHKLQGCPQAPLPSFPSVASVWITESQGTQWISFRGKSTDSPNLGLWRSTSATCTINGFVEHGWEQVNIPAPCSDFTNHWSYLFAHPTDPTLLFKGGIKLCRSTSAGDNMAEESGIHDDQHAIVVVPTSPSLIYFGSDGGIYRSFDKGATLSFIGEGMYNTEILKIDVNAAASPRVIIGGSQDNSSFAWDGSSPVWTSIGAALASGDVPLIVFDRKDHKGLYVMGQSTQQIQDYPASGGSQITQRGSLQDCLAYSEFPGTVSESMDSTGDAPPLLVTCNGIWSGPPWSQIKTAESGDSFVRLRVAPDNPQIAVAATANGHVYWGASLQPSQLYDVYTVPGGGAPSAIAFENEGKFYVATNMNGSGTITRFTCLLGCTTENIWPQSQSPSGIVTAVGVDPLATDTVLAAIQGNGIFQGTRDSQGAWTWVLYNNGIPVGANITDIEAVNDGSIAAAAYGRSAFVLRSRSTTPPPPPTLSAIGHVVAFELEGDDSQPGKPIPKITSARLDSKPGFLFTTLSFAGTGVLQAAFKNHRPVQIKYTSNGENTGRIISASYAGP